MHTFRDNLNRTWPLAINVTAVRQVRDLTGVDLLDAVHPEATVAGHPGSGGSSLYSRLAGDPVLLCNVLYVLCRDEADRRGVSDEEFGKGLAGQAIDDATAALLEELTSFFQFRGPPPPPPEPPATGPRPRTRPGGRPGGRSQGARMNTALAVTEQVMASLARLRHSIQAASGDSSTSAPALPESIPGP